MLPKPQFEPIFPAHAIERCSATVFFDQAIPAKIFGQICQTVEKSLTGIGFVEGSPGIQLQIDIETGKVGTPAERGIVTFATQDRASALTLMPSLIVWQSSQYIRWTHFAQQIESFLAPTLSEVSKVVSISAVQLEYWDRFLWSGSWEDIECRQLLDQSSPFLAEEATRKPYQWHSHAGWFDFSDVGHRQLTNVNVDVLTAVPASATTGKPSVGIYTKLQEQVVPSPGMAETGWIKESEVKEILYSQHVSLKQLLKRLINPHMAARIGL